MQKKKTKPANAKAQMYHSGQQTWMNALTINWYIATGTPIIYIIVHLEGKIIGLGTMTKATPVFHFSGVVNPGIFEVLANGTLTLNASKKTVTYDLTVNSKFVNQFKGTLLNY